MKQLNSIVSQVEYKGLREKVGEMEAKRKGTGGWKFINFFQYYINNNNIIIYYYYF